jgi:hypothetical protein
MAADHGDRRPVVLRPADTLAGPWGLWVATATTHFGSSQRWMSGVLWVEELSQITWRSSPAGTDVSIVVRNFLNSIARCRLVIWEMTRPEATSKAAYRLVVPCRW